MSANRGSNIPCLFPTVGPITVRGRFGMVPYSLPLVPDSLYGIGLCTVLASVHHGIPLDFLKFILMLKYLITKILCQGSINC